MTKPIAAPNLKKQAINADDVWILVGSQAWDFANMPKAERSQAEIELDRILPSNRGSNPPIILDAKFLNNPTAYRIAPKTARFITLQRANNAEPLAEKSITLICALLAEQTEAKSVRLIDEAGNLLEDLSNYVERTRKGETMAEIVAEIVAETQAKQAQGDNTDKRSPYIEKRTENGIKGLYRITPKFDNATGDLLSERVQWLCDVVEVIGIGRSEAESFIVLRWIPEGQYHPIVEAVALKDLGEREGWKQLKARGLKITNNTMLKNELADYLQNSGDRTLWTITNATGWQNGAYILPNGEVIGQPDTPVLFKSQSATFIGYDTQGTLASWQTEIAANVAGNPSMMLGVACALSAPLIGLIDAESFGVHLFGGSTAGKTTTANIAGSIYGHPDKIRLSWNATALGLTNEAAARNDNFMPLDEIGQGSHRKHIEQTAYALFNGVGKIQGAKEGGNREMQRWRIMAFSTGEIDLEGYLSAGGMKTNAGQLVRLLNVPISPAKIYHTFADGKAHADHLNHAAKRHYGIIGRQWLEWLSLAENRHQTTACYQHLKAKWLNRLPTDASPQVQRVAARFAILETALQLASPLTQWTDEQNSEALLHSFNEWVNVFGLHSREEKQVIEQVNGWLLANAEGRFIVYPFDEHQPKIHNIAGYRMRLTETNKHEHFYLYPLAFEEAIKGNPKEQACQILSDKGILKKGEGAYKWLRRTPSKIDPKRTRCYLLYPITEADSEGENEA